MMGDVIRLLPTQLPNRMPVSISKAPPEVGGFTVIIWRDATRDDGLCYYVENLGEVWRLLNTIGDAIHARAQA